MGAHGGGAETNGGNVHVMPPASAVGQDLHRRTLESSLPLGAAPSPPRRLPSSPGRKRTNGCTSVSDMASAPFVLSGSRTTQKDVSAQNVSTPVHVSHGGTIVQTPTRPRWSTNVQTYLGDVGTAEDVGSATPTSPISESLSSPGTLVSNTITKRSSLLADAAAAQARLSALDLAASKSRDGRMSEQKKQRNSCPSDVPSRDQTKENIGQQNIVADNRTRKSRGSSDDRSMSSSSADLNEHGHDKDGTRAVANSRSGKQPPPVCLEVGRAPRASPRRSDDPMEMIPTIINTNFEGGSLPSSARSARSPTSLNFRQMKFGRRLQQACDEGARASVLQNALAQAIAVGCADSQLHSAIVRHGNMALPYVVALEAAVASGRVEDVKAAIANAEAAHLDRHCEQARDEVAAHERRAAEAAEEARALEVAAAVADFDRKRKSWAALEVAVSTANSVDVTGASMEVLVAAKQDLFSAVEAAFAAELSEADLNEAETLRKRIHNAIEDKKGSIRLFCRVRPLLPSEVASGDHDVFQRRDAFTLDVAPHVGGVDQRTFSFDACWFPGSQDEVFADTRDLVQSAVDGYNVTIFAYGQTGAGKTHTMFGCANNPQDCGLCPRVADELFSIMSREGARTEFVITVSFVELYCRRFIDLLDTRRKSLKMRTSLKGETFIEGSSDRPVTSPKDVRRVVELGVKERHSRCTQMNNNSSRSHLILTFKVSCSNRQTGRCQRGKIILVDLAGSERVKRSGVTNDGLREACEVNTSLSALGDVMQALVRKEAHVPYRNHDLTQVMQDSLGGTSKTLMFLNLSPASSSLQESIMSLKYATRAKNFVNDVRLPKQSVLSS
eukprot:TRINITY_DN50473_c0_g1_i1.p1 TRINITY_DN50473_c0_g1~~TRINITY_DN50473_c0_g1_i1.p1  ORF type:complete len:841 (+),score=117.31 TRINITY_DN50473_c0_g1_i1:45-2567(+)